jgi:hypothetical protein
MSRNAFSMHFVKKSQDASSGKVHHNQVHRPGAFRAAVPAVLRPLPLGITCPRTLGPTTHRWKKVDWTHPAIGRIRCSDASLVQLLNASGQRRIAVDWTHPVPGSIRAATHRPGKGDKLDASSSGTHPGSDASPLTGRIQFPDASGQRRIAGKGDNWTHPVPNWTHPVSGSGRIRAATHRR